MAQSSIDNDLKSIGKLCLELCQTSVAIGHEVKLSMNIGSTFSFNYSSENNGSPLPAAVEKEKPKKKSRATLQRDRQRRAAFLLKKAGSSEIGPPLAVERPLLEPPEVTNGYVETILSPSSSPSETRSSDPESNDLEDNPDSPVTLLATKEGTINTFCICSSVPCVCLASKPLSPINHQPEVPRVKIKKTTDGWSSSTSSPNPLCTNCGQPFLNSEHQCVDDHDENQEDSKHESTCAPEVDILDYQACHDVVVNGFFSPHDKIQILQRNCISLLKIEPVDFELAKFCFSRSKYFQLRQSDQSLGINMQKIVNIFNKEFEDEMKKHYT